MAGITPQKARDIRAKKGLAENRLATMRYNRGMSRSGLAAASGVSERAIKSYEQGERQIERASIETLCDICLALNCKIEDIIEDASIRKKLKALQQ